jgi:hypothetical protein
MNCENTREEREETDAVIINNNPVTPSTPFVEQLERVSDITAHTRLTRNKLVIVLITLVAFALLIEITTLTTGARISAKMNSSDIIPTIRNILMLARISPTNSSVMINDIRTYNYSRF